jgi:hypothetical protein
LDRRDFGKKRNYATEVIGNIRQQAWGRERRSTADLIHARMIQFQALGMAARVTNTSENASKPQRFARESRSEVGWILTRKTLTFDQNRTWTLGRKAIHCGWV